MKVVFIEYLPLTRKIEKDFYIDDLLEASIEVEYWDITKLYFPHLTLNDRVERAYIRTVSSWKHLESLLNATDTNKTLFIPQITFSGRVIHLFRVLTKHRCELGFFARGMLPFPATGRKSFGKLVTVIRKSSFSESMRKVKGLLLDNVAFHAKRLGFLKTFDVVFQAGSEGIKTIGVGYQLDLERARIIRINYFDYDNFLKLKQSTGRAYAGRYAVFLDEFLPYHPDFAILNLGTVKAESYYESLNTFFAQVELKFNLNVVIAAHPKAQYQKNPFGGRAIFFNKTCELAKDSLFAMAHASTSISYPILFGIPIVFIWDSQIREIYTNGLYKSILNFASVLGMPSYCTDDVKFGKEILLSDVTPAKYDDYKYKYLESRESEGELSSSIVVAELNR